MTKSILYFLSTFDISSGATRSLLRLVSIVEDSDFRVIIILPEHGNVEDELVNKGIKYYVVKQYIWNYWIKYLSHTKNIFYYLKLPLKYLLNRISFHKINRIIKKEKVDIIHMNTLTSFLGAQAAIKQRKILIWHIREFMEEDLGIEFCNRKKAIDLINKSTCVISISDSISKNFSNEVLAYKKVIHNGLSIDDYFIDKVAFQNQKINILSSGRITPGKGQVDLVRAIANLPERYKQMFKVDIIGIVESEEYFKEIKEVISNYKLDGIEFHGFQSDPTDFFRKCDIVCVCSKKEAFGRITVEGMLSGALVIGTNSGGTKEIISTGETGYLYEPGDYMQLSEILKTIINNRSSILEIALRGQEKATLRFSDKNNAMQIMQLYKELEN